jgi:hypothetical protein
VNVLCPTISFWPQSLTLMGGVVAFCLTTGALSLPAWAEEKRNALAVFGGVLTDNDWQETFEPWDVDYRQSGFVAVAASHVLSQPDPRYSFEIEGQIVRHFGDQDHWELNLPIIARWHAFPWDDVIDTSLAFGAGPSYASEVPPVEVENDGDSQRFLVYWTAEVEVGPPADDWRFFFRLHHRSGAFGLVADEGGSNAYVIGVRFPF